MPELTTAPTGFFGAVRSLFGNLVAIIQNRFELLTLELREEKERVVGIAIWGGVMAVCAFMALITLSFLLVVAFWDQAVWVLLGLTVAYLVTALIAYLMVRLRVKEPLFGETINQLKKDREWLTLGK